MGYQQVKGGTMDKSQNEEGLRARTRVVRASLALKLLSRILGEPSLWGTQSCQLSFRDNGCFRVTLPRAGLIHAHWISLDEEQAQRHDKWTDRDG